METRKASKTRPHSDSFLHFQRETLGIIVLGKTKLESAISFGLSVCPSVYNYGKAASGEEDVWAERNARQDFKKQNITGTAYDKSFRS